MFTKLNAIIIFLLFVLNCAKPSEPQYDEGGNNYKIQPLRITQNQIGPFNIKKIRKVKDIYQQVKDYQEYDVVKHEKRKIILSRYDINTLIFNINKWGWITKISCIDNCKFKKLKIGNPGKKIKKIKGIKKVKKFKKKKKGKALFKKGNLRIHIRKSMIFKFSVIY